MELVRITKKSSGLRAIKKLYKRAFPKDERAPFGVLVKRADPKKADFWGAYDGGEFVGMAYTVKSPRLAYLYYLAVNANKRDKGYGTEIVAELKRRYDGRVLFLALESLDKTAKNYDRRVRRHGFYERCGFSDLPYKIKEASVVYDVMSYGGEFMPHEYRDMMSDFLGKRQTRIVNPEMF